MDTESTEGRRVRPRAGRRPHAVTGSLLRFDLAGEVRALAHEPEWVEQGHNAKTLVKSPDVRVVLIALKAGCGMRKHKTDQCLTLHALEGRLAVRVPGQALDIPAGTMIALGQTVVHDVVAIEDSVLLLTLGWSKA